MRLIDLGVTRVVLLISIQTRVRTNELYSLSAKRTALVIFVLSMAYLLDLEVGGGDVPCRAAWVSAISRITCHVSYLLTITRWEDRDVPYFGSFFLVVNFRAFSFARWTAAAAFSPTKPSMFSLGTVL